MAAVSSTAPSATSPAPSAIVRHDGDIKAVIFDLGGTLKYQKDKRKIKEQKNGVLADWVVAHFATTGATVVIPTPSAASPATPATSDAKNDGSSSTSGSGSDVRSLFISEWRQILLSWKREKRISKLVLAEKPADVLLKQCLIKLFGEASVAEHWTDDTAKRALDTYFQAELAASTLFPGVMEMLQALKDQGMALAVVTNSADTPKQLAVLDQLDLTRWFDPIIVSAEVGYRKPDSRIFRMVFDMWEKKGLHFARDEVVMIGDVLSRDVLGAQRIGMRSVLIEWPGEIDKSNLKFRDTVHADRVITAMTELPAAIQSITEQWRTYHKLHGHPAVIHSHNPLLSCDCTTAAVSSSTDDSSPASPSNGGCSNNASCSVHRPRSRGTRAITPSSSSVSHFTPANTPAAAATGTPVPKNAIVTPSTSTPSLSHHHHVPPASLLGSGVTPFFHPLRIGYAFNTKKSNTCRAEHWFDTEYREDATYVEVDIKLPLEPQGPFDVLLLKLTDYMVRDDDESVGVIARFRAYIAAHPSIVVVDPFEHVATCLNRSLIHATLASAELKTADGIHVAAPLSGLVTLPLVHATMADTSGITVSVPLYESKNSTSSITTSEAKISWPVICKRVEACGSTLSHHMVIVTQASGLAKLDEGNWLVQQYVNHDRILHKVYVLGSDTTIISKYGSLPNLDVSVDHDNIYVDSHHLSAFSIGRALHSAPSSSSSRPELLREKSLDVGLTHVETPASAVLVATVHDIAAQLRTRLGVSLFGFDVIEPTTAATTTSGGTSGISYYIVDINHFPSYDGVTEFPQKLLNFLCDHWRSKQTKATIAAAAITATATATIVTTTT